MSAPRFQINVSFEARTDLSDIFLFTEQQWGERQRETYELLIGNAFATLSQSPGLGRLCDEFSPGLRSYPAGSHLVYYWVIGSTLTVARVLHQRQDPTGETWEQASSDDFRENGHDCH